jgi:hypothetical protein
MAVVLRGRDKMAPPKTTGGYVDDHDWHAQFRELRSAVDALQERLHACHQWLADNVVASDVLPRKYPEPISSDLNAAHVAAQTIANLAGLLKDRLCAEPTARFLNGWRLTREQYFLLRASGIEFGTAHMLELSPVDEYDLFTNLCYEDPERFAYVNPSLEPRKPRDKVGVRFGQPPEELSRAFLRPEQEAFVQRHLPNVYERFGN